MAHPAGEGQMEESQSNSPVQESWADILLEMTFELGTAKRPPADDAVDSTGGRTEACAKPDAFKEICGGGKGLGTTIVSHMCDASGHPVRG